MNKTTLLLVIVLAFNAYQFLPQVNLQQYFAFTNTASIVEQMSPVIDNAFDQAEEKYIKKEIEVVDGLDPDPDKCICKGTGIVVNGDGHISPCEYHSKKSTEATVAEKQEIETGEVTLDDDTYQVVILSSYSCNPCNNMFKSITPQLQSRGISIAQNSSAKVRIIKLEDDPVGYRIYEKAAAEFQRNQGIAFSRKYPTFLEVRNNFVTNVRVGVQSYQQIISNYELEN